MSDRKSERFNAPDEAGGPGFLGGERGAPEGEDLGALIDALEALFGFGDGFDGRDPELLGCWSVQDNADALPAVFHAQDGTGQHAAEAKIVAAGGRFKEAVRLGGRQEIDDGLDANGYGLFEGFVELQSDFASGFETLGGGAERVLLEEQEFGGRVSLALKGQGIGAEKLGFVRRGIFDGV